LIRRSSLSKGEKSYYVKEMILEYGNEMKKNLLEIGALSHEEIKDLIVSELRELGNFLRKIEKEYE
jgi:predicted nuclease of predicted toxin-antitoxin system